MACRRRLVRILKWLKRWTWDVFFLSDHDWKRKHCPTMFWYLFEATEEERNRFWKG